MIEIIKQLKSLRDKTKAEMQKHEEIDQRYIKLKKVYLMLNLSIQILNIKV
jgi:hypothetical protein